MTHAIDSRFISKDATLALRRDQLIQQASTDQLQYIHGNHTFCGRGNGCNDEPNEFVAGMTPKYLTDTQATLKLAWTRWSNTPQKKEPINQFLYLAGIFSPPATGTSRTVPFYYQNRYTSFYGPDYLSTSPDSYGLCQYQTMLASAVVDTTGRITSFTDRDGYLNTFTYTGTSVNASNWTRTCTNPPCL
jgi:hypothetical protein